MLASRDVRSALDRLERALVDSGNPKLRTLVLDGAPADGSWPAELPPLARDAATWLSWRADGGDDDPRWLDVLEPNEPFCRLLSLQSAAELSRQLRAAGELGDSIPILGEGPVFVCDADGSVFHVDTLASDDPDAPVSRSLVPLGLDVAGFIDRIAAEYEARRSSPWHRMRIEPLADATWSPATAVDAAGLSHAPDGTALLWSAVRRSRARAWVAVKIDDRWATAMTFWPDPGEVTSLDAEQGCRSLRHSFATGDVVTQSSDDLVATLQRATTVVRGTVRRWTQPSVAALLARLDQLRRRVPELRFAGGASPEELAALTDKTGCALPDDLRALYAYANGSHAAVFWRYRLVPIAGATAIMSSMMQLRADQFGPSYWDRSFVPLLDKGNSDALYVDVAGVHGPRGCVIDFNHERPAIREVLYESVAQWLECLVDGLESNVYEWSDDAVFPRGFIARGEMAIARVHDAVRTNHAYPWARRLALADERAR